MNYFLVGIKGTGMAGLAMLLYEEGHHVMGSDEETHYYTEDELREKDIMIFSFNSENIDGHDIYIIGNAYHLPKDENIILTPALQEVKTIIDNDYKHYYYHEFIGLMIHKRLIGVTGTHGKTTTTSLLVQMLDRKCSYIIGDGTGGGYSNDLLVVEACEYQEHFLAYKPEILLINNIELDHPDYYTSKRKLLKAFQKASDNSQTIIANGDDELINKIRHKHKITYGFNKENDYQIKIIDKVNDKEVGYHINLINQDESITLFVPFLGLHMIKNFVASYLTCSLLLIKPTLTNLSLPKRRMTEYIYNNNILIDDYAHHPTEIKCLYEALKSKYPDYLQKVIFQPHTYSRTLTLKKDFIKAFDLFDKIYLDDVFSSKREKCNPKLQKKVDDYFKKYPKFNLEILNEINGNNKEIWIFLGAGIINQYIKSIITIKE